jgi:hypothetical protein
MVSAYPFSLIRVLAGKSEFLYPLKTSIDGCSGDPKR